MKPAGHVIAVHVGLQQDFSETSVTLEASVIFSLPQGQVIVLQVATQQESTELPTILGIGNCSIEPHVASQQASDV